MNLFGQDVSGGSCSWLRAVALAGLCIGCAAAMAAQEKSTPWDAAVEARAQFEAEPAGAHTRREYAEVMDGFRAIYHANPGDAHAARAVAQVAELLAEQGREFGDTKSLHDAAGQYEYLAKAYPGGSMAPIALNRALDLLGPGDAAEKSRVKTELAEDYPRYSSTDAARSADTGSITKGSVSVHSEPKVEDAQSALETSAAKTSRTDIMPDNEGLSGQEAAPSAVRAGTATRSSAGPLSVVTGIRHWSTASYTRVAIDLAVDPNEEVKYQAARVEDPDRIFFDLHHARLAPQLAGKSFNVTDDGFLTKIRAAQFSGDVTRVVLDVHGVAEYSAFLLPNPYRLIIDIHGKQAAASPEQVSSGSVPALEPQPVAPASAVPLHGQAAEVSNLPPMPVTDGSTGFGLPTRGAGTARRATPVARARVVISSKPTDAVPVPNTVTNTSTETGTEVAAVSKQQGKVEATKRPTSKPISSAPRQQASFQPAAGVDGKTSSALTLSETDGRGSGDEIETSETPSSAHRGSLRPGGHLHSFDAERATDTETVLSQPVAASELSSNGRTSLTRALGLKIGRIVIDAGHGGHDSGTLGVGGIEEKDVVLDVALRLGKLLHDRLGAEIVYTRADDTFIPLETRTAIANKAQADLFISVHANSSQDESARGVEVYYLNFTSDPEAMRVASRENAVSTESVHELSDLVKKIALRDKIDESRELAGDVDTSLYAGLRRGNTALKDRGVKKAPFVVLIGANMPSILAEISFVTNSVDAAKLDTPEYRERVAESLYRGIARYAEGVNGLTPGQHTVEHAQR